MEYPAGVEEVARGSTDTAELQPACLKSSAVIRRCFPKSLLSTGAWLVLGTVTRRLGL